MGCRVNFAFSFVRGVDLFAGAGGFTAGAKRALKILGLLSRFTCLNHWRKAVNTHELNHPEDEHICDECELIKPADIIKDPEKLFLLLAGPECFRTGTTILTKRGLVPIEAVKVGDFVLTHLLRWRRVTAVMKQVADTVILKGHGHSGFEVTSAHPFYTRTFKTSWKGKFHSVGQRIWQNPTWSPAGEIVGKYWATPTAFPSMPIPDCPLGELSPLGWWLAGRYLADGYLDTRKKRGGVVSIACGADKRVELESKLSGWGVEWTWRWVRTAWLVEARHHRLVHWLGSEFGKLAHKKHLPVWLLGAPVYMRRALLDGYLAGDGTRGGPRFDCSTVSKELAVGIRLLAESLGHSTHTHYLPAGNYTIEGRCGEAKAQHRVMWQRNPKVFQTYEFGDNISWSKVKKCISGNKGVQVFNISVDEDESYVADGIIVHNCVNFSQARGGRPKDDQSRSNAWRVPEWLEAKTPEVCLVENVREFEKWGPLRQMRHKKTRRLLWEKFTWVASKHGNRPVKKCKPATTRQPPLRRTSEETEEDYWKRLENIGWQPAMEADPDRLGQTFREWVERCRHAGPGYHVEHKVLCAADCGEPTIRRRLFIQMHRKDTGRTPVWPNPVCEKPDKHGRTPNGLPPWPSARDRVIDWSNLGTSIFRRKKPLAPKTMRRILMGFQKYGLQPFVLPQHQGNKNPNLRSTDDPLSAVTAKHTGEGLLTPILINTAHGKDEVRAQPTEEPVKTIAGNRGDLALVTAAILHCVETNTPYNTRKGRKALSEFVSKRIEIQRSFEDRIPTFREWYAKAKPYGGSREEYDRLYKEDYDQDDYDGHGKELPASLIKLRGTSDAGSVDEPVPGITAGGKHLGLAQPFLVEVAHGNIKREMNPDGRRSKSVDGPMGAITSGGIQVGLANAFLVPHFGERAGQEPRTHSVDGPLPAVTASKGAASLCMPMVVEIDHRGNGDRGAKAVDGPMSVQTTKQRHALAIPWLYTYYSSGSPGAAIDAPMPTARCKDGVGLCYPVVEIDDRRYIIDIYFRMLTEQELARGQGFDPEYKFVGNKTEVVRQIGNAVPPGMGCMLALAAISQNPNVIEFFREEVAA